MYLWRLWKLSVLKFISFLMLLELYNVRNGVKFKIIEFSLVILELRK